jgi:hypothetical protein
MQPMRTESAAREPVPGAPPRTPPTPRAQLSRVVVAAGAAILLGAGPAVAWDLSTQPPRAAPRTGWPQPSPWLSAGKQMKAAAGGIARIYLPRVATPPVDSADPSASVAMPSPAVPTTTATTGPVVLTIPTLYPPPYRVPRR